MLTLNELFTSILLVECLVDYRTSEIINHELKDRLDFLLRVSSVIRDSLILRIVNNYHNIKS